MLTRSSAPGASGTWVVDGNALLGIIIAVYDGEDYAHMLPIGPVFASIQAVCRQGSQLPSLKVLDQKWSVLENMGARRLRPTTGFQTEIRRASKQSEEATGDAPTIDNDPEKQESQAAAPSERSLSGWETYEILAPMLLMVVAIALDISAFSIIMPPITDTFNSVKMIGWYGSCYFLAVGVTYPTFSSLYQGLAPALRHWSSWILISTSMATFIAGGLCSYLVSSNGGILVGRTLSGIGASGTLSGTMFIVKELFPIQKRVWSIILTTFAVTRFLAPTLAGLNAALFAEMLGGAVGIAAAQAVFVGQLSHAIPDTRIDMYEQIVLRGGATNFRDKLTGDILEIVLETFSKALTRTFYVATGAGALPFAIVVTITALLITGAVPYLLWRRT
ncbi:hypothetical protein CC86DRAFT_466786 [Ophiobolus disseminans]|uniref:MFS general substrate transporter n=1 Tax=Ophiobolus disseminans TaxID=1469910 RepID=A0A6A7A2H0_9PLEO|nr:hypothetical protein CC86DRAFT_466786 [Ophiobolus disseminans]